MEEKMQLKVGSHPSGWIFCKNLLQMPKTICMLFQLLNATYTTELIKSNRIDMYIYIHTQL